MTAFESHSIADTALIAARLVPRLHPGSVLALYGDLGSGKTCFVRGLAAALKITVPVTSPTYTLIHEYASTPPLYHMDLYRLSHPDALDELGLEEYFERDGITVIEWAERAEHLLPARTLRLTFEVVKYPEKRIITLKEPV
ncbi:MAG TPA: tRNA (adenosine(37)-N6)-threonylcarbamoyltransferase complex ATPase subunit type 1 TsaE [Verrucomicrobia bacterium]|nr:tRNA (adenosine(37)-N6)-threonylcarbamoyltransferase complex ATPase subunit type 1 TsaE [Verrucomicrobiota bacterium]